MPRFARAVVPECPHHVTQRGNNHQDVFFVRDDYRLYLDILREQAGLHGLRILLSPSTWRGIMLVASGSAC